MKMQAITTGDYSAVYWPKILDRLQQILAREPGSRMTSFSHEEMYRMVYNVCCQSHQRSLYLDLRKTVAEYLHYVAETVAAMCDDQLLLCYATYVDHYMVCVDLLCPVFLYLERTYLHVKLQTSLRYELASLFRECVVDHSVVRGRLSATLHMLADTRPWVDMPCLEVAIKSIHVFDPGFAQQFPILLSRFVPGYTMGEGTDSASKWGVARQKREGEEMDRFDEGLKRALLDGQPHVGLSVTMDR